MLRSGRKFSFSYNEKLHLKRDFQKVLQKGKRISAGFIIILVFQRQDGDEIRRLGLITSGKVGSAAERNKAKRRLREIFRKNKHSLLPGLDIIFILRPNIKFVGYTEMQNTVLDCLKSAGFCSDI